MTSTKVGRKTKGRRKRLAELHSDHETRGKRLVRRRIELGLSQIEVAECAEIGQAHLSNLENNKTEPSIKALVRLAGVLGVSIDYLQHGEAA